MKASRLLTVLETLMTQPRAVFLWGAPGVGKSAVVRQVGKKLGLPVIDLRATLLDPTDLRGIPMLKNGQAVWCPPSFLPKDSEKPGILFLDELNAAPPLVQASMYQLVLDRRIGEYSLPDGWKIIAAGNRQSDRAVTFRMSSALANRFIHITLEADSQSWQDWAVRAGVHPLVTAFIRFKPKLLWHAKDGETAFASPRSWEMLSDVVKSFGDPLAVRDIMRGIVGEGPSAEFAEFARNSLSAQEIAAILADPENAPLPTSLDKVWTLITRIGADASDDGVADAGAKLLKRLQPEFAVVMARDILTVRPGFVMNPDFLAFMKEHNKLFNTL